MFEPIQELPIDLYQQKYTLGELSRPVAPHAYERGVLSVPDATKVPTPGTPLYYNGTRFAEPTDAATLAQTIGVLGTTYDRATKAYADGDTIEVLSLGHIVVKNGAGAVVFGDYLRYELASRSWIKYTIPAGTTAGNAHDQLNFFRGVHVRVSTLGTTAANALVEIKVIA